MKIASIQIKNVLGIDEYEIKPRQFTLITGKNGSGKSSIIKSIETALGGGDYAKLQRKGSTASEIVIVFDDSTTVQRKFTADNSTVKVTTDEVKYPKPQTLLDTLYDLAQVNPIKLLADDKQSRDARLSTVLRCIDYKMTPADVDALCNWDNVASKLSVNYNSHGLAVLDAVTKIVFDRRTDVNRDLKRLQNAAAELRSTLAERVADDVDTLYANVDTAIAELDAQMTKYERDLSAVRASKRDEAIATRNTKDDAARMEYNRIVAEALRVRDAAIEANAQECQTLLDAASDEWSVAIDQKTVKYNEVRAPLVAQRAKLDEQRINKARIDEQYKIVDKYDEEIKTNDEKSKNLDALIEKLRNERTRVSGTLPVDGLDIRDGELYYNDISFDTLNTALRTKIAVDIAVATAKARQMHFICVDGCEVLDEQSFEIFEREIEQHKDMQFILTRVSNDALRVDTKD